MALNSGLKFEGSGKFVQEREWTCPKHDWPMQHECDCSHCNRRWDCRSCARAKWVDLTNDDGTPKMRELSVWEVSFQSMWATQLARENLLLDAILNWDENVEMPRIVWMEDEVG